ncbi:MAG: sugar phosphate nucleotidyltransferase [Nitrospirota bacterium]
MGEQQTHDGPLSRESLLAAARHGGARTFISPSRCGVVLAGGDGWRLQSFIRRVRGGILPKQYVNFVGTRSMLEHTFHRVERLIPADRLFTVVSRDHLRYPEVRRQLAGRPNGTVILQPENRETGPGLLLPLMHLHAQFGDALVAVFPSDHFILDEAAFMGHVDLACRAVERDPSCVVLLGMEPEGPEPEYGYILPDSDDGQSKPSSARPLSCFIEKPGTDVARDLILRGGLWNTLVMAFQVKTLLGLVREVTPDLYRAFEQIGVAIGTSCEAEVVETTYRMMERVNLSRDVLEVLARRRPSPLRVLPVRGVGWNDWGSEERIVKDLKDTGCAGRMYSSPPVVETVLREKRLNAQA